jgi:hypothetical protein
MPTPTINNRRIYNIVLAIGFNRDFFDTLLVTLGCGGFCTRTVFTLTVLG